MTTKASVAIINVGGIEFKGLQLPNGEYAIAIKQIERLDLAKHNTGTRTLKRLLGKDIPLSKTLTETNSNKQTIVSLDVFEKFLTELAFTGNEFAHDRNLYACGRFLCMLYFKSKPYQYFKTHEKPRCLLRFSQYAHKNLYRLTVRNQSVG